MNLDTTASMRFLWVSTFCLLMTLSLVGLQVLGLSWFICAFIWNHGPNEVSSIELFSDGKMHRISKILPATFTIVLLPSSTQGGLSMYFKDKNGEKHGLKNSGFIHGTILKVDISSKNEASLSQYGLSIID